MTAGAADLRSWPTVLSVREAGLRGRRALSEEGLENPRLESAILLGSVLRLDSAALLIHGEDRLSALQFAEFQSLLVRRLRREPSAYITGTRPWLDMDIAVNRNVLIPRPETETLVRLVIPDVRHLITGLGRPPTIVDVGTGSGAIACALARAFPDARHLATDTEVGALRLAERNAERLAGGRIEFVRSDLLPPGMGADLVVANLPYIPTHELAGLEPELAYEPRSALDGGVNGLRAIHCLLLRLQGCVQPGGVAWLECHHDQAEPIRSIAHTVMRSCRVSVEADLAGIARFVRIELR